MEEFLSMRTTISLCFADMGEMTFHLHFANYFSFSLQNSFLTFHLLSFLFSFTLAKTQHKVPREYEFRYKVPLGYKVAFVRERFTSNVGFLGANFAFVNERFTPNVELFGTNSNFVVPTMWDFSTRIRI